MRARVQEMLSDVQYGYLVARSKLALLALAAILALMFQDGIPSQAQAQTNTALKQNLLVMLGDSLTAGYGLPPEDAFPTRLEKALRTAGIDMRISNAGVSGDTTAGGRARIDWAFADRPAFAIVALGANDALRGIDPKDTRENLEKIILDLKARGIKVMLVGMLAPPNLGKDYGTRFNGIYGELAQKHALPLYPFFLDGVAADASLNQADGIHPNAKGVGVLVERMLPAVRKFIGK